MKNHNNNNKKELPMERLINFSQTTIQQHKFLFPFIKIADCLKPHKNTQTHHKWTHTHSFLSSSMLDIELYFFFSMYVWLTDSVVVYAIA